MNYTENGYKFDIVYVIDGTNNGSIIDAVKDKIKRVPELIYKKLTDEGRLLERIREKLVFFGDYATEGKNAVIETEFFNIPDDNDELYKQFERADIRMNGGDSAENGLEALFKAMCSDWTPLGNVKNLNGESTYIRGRHIIVVISDAYPLRLQERAGCVGYIDDDYPADAAALQEVWDTAGTQESITSLSRKNRRLILCVPEGMDYHEHTWEDVYCLMRTALFSVERNGDCREIDENRLAYEMIVDIVRDLTD